MTKVTNVDADDYVDEEDAVVAVAGVVAAFAVGSVGSLATVFRYPPAVESFHASWNHQGFPGYC